MGRLVVGLSLALLAVPAATGGQGPGMRLFPVQLNIEGSYVKTTTVLRLPYKPYAQTARSMTGLALDEDERMFLRFVEAVRSNDLRSLEAILAKPALSATKPQNSSVITSPRTAAQTLAIYRQSFGGFEDLRVEGSVPLDDGVLFIWTAGTAKGRMVRGTVVKSEAGKRQVAEVTMEQPVETFIVNTLNRLSAEELSGLQGAAPATNYALALTKSGVEFRFSGTRPNTKVPGAGTLSGPMVTLAEKIRASHANSVERLLALHTPKSSAKLQQWFGTMNRVALDAYLIDLARPRDVRLVMDAGAVVIAFSAPQSTGGSPSRDVGYDYLVRQGDTYKIANVLYASFFDDVLKNTTAVARFLEQEAPRK